MKKYRFLTYIAILYLFTPIQTYAFSFSEYEKTDQVKTASEKKTISSKDLHCLHGKKIAVMVGEKHTNGWRQTQSSKHGYMVEELNAQLKKLGLQTYSPAEINQQIARAEQEAFLNNDPEAAINAAKRLSAKYFLKGVISTKTGKNPIIGIDEVFINLSLTLVSQNGKNLANGQLSDAVFSDSDTIATALKLVKTKSAQVISELFKDFCKK